MILYSHIEAIKQHERADRLQREEDKIHNECRWCGLPISGWFRKTCQCDYENEY